MLVLASYVRQSQKSLSPASRGGLLGVRVRTTVIPAQERGNLAEFGINHRAERIELPPFKPGVGSAASAGMTEQGRERSGVAAFETASRALSCEG